MGKARLQENIIKKIKELKTTECIEVLICSHTRKCGWAGFEFQQSRKKSRYIEEAVDMCCPRCGNAEFYIEFKSRQKIIDSI